MKKLRYVFYLVLVAFFTSCGEGKLDGKILTDENGYKYKLRYAKNGWYEVQPITIHLKETVSCN